MKIALVSPYDWTVSGGVNNHIHHLAEQFVQLGHEPHIIAAGSKPAHSEICPVTTIGRPIPLRVSGSVARITLSLRTAGAVKRVLADIQAGRFVKNFVLDNRAGQPELKAARKAAAAHPIEGPGQHRGDRGRRREGVAVPQPAP